MAKKRDEESSTPEAERAQQTQAEHLERGGALLLGWGKRIFHIVGSFMVFMGIAALITDPDVGLPLLLFGAVFWGFSSFVFRMIEKIESTRPLPGEPAPSKHDIDSPGTPTDAG